MAWVAHNTYGNESYQISWAAYKEELVRDAGGRGLAFEAIKAIPGEGQGSLLRLPFGKRGTSSERARKEAPSPDGALSPPARHMSASPARSGW